LRARAAAAICSLLASLLLILAPGSALGVGLPSGFQDEIVIAGLDEPTALQFSPDGRIFVAEKAGIIKIYESIADENPVEFADLRTKVYDSGDRGLLGFALDPEFPARPYVYVLYSHDAPIGGTAPVWGEEDEAGDGCPNPPGSNTDGCVISGRLSRLTAVGNQASGEQVLIEDWCQQFPSHSIGDLHFDADGMLYASAGDGASYSVRDYGQFGFPEVNPCGDPPAGVGGIMAPPSAEGGALRAQDVLTPEDPTGLDGTIIRIDPDTGEGLPDNPMATSLDANARRIVAFGFRNPFRFTIHPETREVYVGNVGQGSYEELDRFAPTSIETFNSGWPCYEGDIRPYSEVGLGLCESFYADPDSNPAPFFAYHHILGVFPGDTCSVSEGSAISGLAFYDGGAFPASYEGALFFADSVRGCIYAMFPGEDGRPDPSTVAPFLSDAAPYPGIDIEVGPEGNLYYVSIVTEAGGEFEPGAVHRISYFSGNQPPVARLVADKQWGGEPLEVEFDAAGSSDADDDQLQYEWDLDGDGIFDPPTSTGTAGETYLDDENYIATVRVSDGNGASSVARLTIYPDNTPPQPEIAAPTEALEWAVGEDVDFSGTAEDDEDDELPSTSLDWSARLFHCPAEGCHAHSLQAFPGVDSGSFAAPDHGHPSRIELTLTAVDSRGLAAKETVTIHPRTVELTIESDPPGVAVEAGLLSKAAPFTLTSIEGSNVTLSAPASAQLDGETYSWQSWSDGGERVHTVVAGASASYVAMYAKDEEEGGKEEGSGGNGGGGGSGAPAVGPFEVPPLGTTPLWTRIDRHPKKRTRSSIARFAFSASSPGATFFCKLNGEPYTPSGSPHVYRNLRPGRHVFRVAAVLAGERDQTPATFRWRVLPRD